MTQDKPKPGDRVRVSFETVVNYAGNFPGSKMTGWFDLDNYSVEVIKRADDPAADPIGTVRETNLSVAVKTAAKSYPWKMVNRSLTVDPRNIDGFMNESRALGRIIGAMPGTPAAE